MGLLLCSTHGYWETLKTLLTPILMLPLSIFNLSDTSCLRMQSYEVSQINWGGVIALVASVAIYYRMPFINSSMRKSKLFLPLNKSLFWFLVAVIVLLTWIGARPVENPYIITGQLLTVLYFRRFMLNSRALRC